MARVTGIGGVFFASADPPRLAAWYERHLGIDPAPTSYDTAPWQQSAGPCVLAPMASGGPHVADGWSINLRVDDLDGIVRELESAGVAVDLDPTPYPNGRFAELRDPEGNLVQLWQVAAGAA